MKIFLPVAFGLSWLAALPLWLGGGLTSGPFRILATIMMFTPTLGVLAVWASKRTPFRQWARETGLTFGPRPGRTVLVMVGAWLGTLVVIALALLASVALGLITLDFHFRTFEAAMRAQGAHVPLSVGTLVLVQLVAGAVASPLLNAIPTFGEEWGWRGWLLPNLVSRFGTARAL
ncbi:MAG: CPBP family intramembrane metalloprotease, partial [Nonomuraea sp.]|nr:CPBP family intramembrane metalloprotease [Nonomuraea sp.]